MQIIFFKLKNFLSIYNATGKTELSFNRESSLNRLILILGANGSGKSSILDELSPLPLEHTNFRNKSRILKDKVGNKTIVYKLDNGVYYKCEIIYDKKTICYLNVSSDNKTWENLNQNGNVNTYIELLETHLGFSKNYIKVGYLSSAISNFIVMKPTERNDYISEWLPDIDIYLKAHKIVTTKHNQKKREIDMINRELGKLTTINYETEINKLEVNKKEVLKQKEDCIKNNAVLESYLNKFIEIQPAFKSLVFSKNLILDNGNIILKNKEELNLFYKDNKDIFDNHNKPEVIQELITEAELKLIKNNESLYNFNLRIEKLKESIYKKEQHSSNKSNESLPDVEARIQYARKEYDSLVEDKESYEKHYKTIYDICLELNGETLYELTAIIEHLYFLYNNLSAQINLNISHLETDLDKHKNNIIKLKKEINEKNEDINTINKKLSFSDNNHILIDMYNSAPSNCSIQTCKLLNTLKSFIDSNDDIKSTESLKAVLFKRIETCNIEIEETLESIQIIQNDISTLIKIDKYIMENKNKIATFPKEFVDYFSEKDFSILRNNLDQMQNDMSLIKTIVSLLDRIKNVENELSQLESLKIKLINDSLLKEEYEELERLNNSVVYLNSEITKLNDRIILLKGSASIFQKYKDDKEFIDNQIKEYKISIEKLKKLAQCKYYFTGIKNLKVRKELDLAHYNKILEEIESKQDKFKTEHSNKTKLEAIRNEGLKLLRKYKVLSDTWSPKIGYASWEISAFLDILKNQTNNDLAEMWGSELKIESFNVDLNEFSIKINKNGNIIDDAILCSSGEQATLVTAISFAIIALNASSKMYNVLRLDEVDAVLDSNKRRGFLSILMDRIEKMNCQSCFVVTHNNEFDTVEADVILMSDVDEMNLENKNIIYRNN